MTGQITVENMKAILPFVTLLIIAISGWVRMEMTQLSDDNRLTNLEHKLSDKAMSDFVRWQTDTEWRVKNLETKECR